LLLGLPRGRTVRVPSCEWELPFGSVPMENVRPFEVSAKMWLLPDTSDVNLVVSQMLSNCDSKASYERARTFPLFSMHHRSLAT
jgi:hypothetical protein